MSNANQIGLRKQQLPATVFLIDDDKVVLRRWTKEYLRGTNMGVLTANDLKTAADMLDEGVPFGAVLADVNFRPETQYEEKQLHSGLDFLAYVRKVRPDIPLYVMSMDSEDKASRQMAKDKDIPVRDWYDKLAPRSNHLTPWARIERDVIVEALKCESTLRSKATEMGESPVDLLTDEHVAEKVRCIFNYPRLTYLQQLPEGCEYRLKKPIEVHCWPESDQYKATAVHIPLLVEAFGLDVVEAIDNLAAVIVAEKCTLDSEGVRVTGYARFVKERLDGYLEREQVSA